VKKSWPDLSSSICEMIASIRTAVLSMDGYGLRSSISYAFHNSHREHDPGLITFLSRRLFDLASGPCNFILLNPFRVGCILRIISDCFSGRPVSWLKATQQRATNWQCWIMLLRCHRQQNATGSIILRGLSFI
jgi:hypothetical protein